MATTQRIRNPMSSPAGVNNRNHRASTVQFKVLTLLFFVAASISTVLYVRSAVAVVAPNKSTGEALRGAVMTGEGAVYDEPPILRGRSKDGDGEGGKFIDYSASPALAAPSSSDQQEEDDDTSISDGEGSDQSSLLTLSTSLGPVNIRLRPDLSSESVRYIRRIVASPEPCDPPCHFYRAEKPGILQGKIAKRGVPPNKVLGPCPEEYRDKPASGRKCPPHDPNCGCHGPVMTRGMVAWAGGGGGPDFFIDLYQRPAEFWANDHTVWGEIADRESLTLLDGMFDLPTTKRGSMTFLDEKVHFDLKAVEE